MNGLTRWAMPLACALCACAAAPPATTGTTAQRPREHPSQRSMTHALERVSPDAIRCLPAAVSVTVVGEFEGSSGAFSVSRINGAAGAGYAVETCVRAAAEHARVHPFTDESAPFTFAFSSTTAPASGTVATATPENPAVAPTVPTGTPVVPMMQIDTRPMPVDLVRRESDALQRCYEQAAQRDHTISGSIELHVVLDASGAPVRVTTHVESPPHEDITLMELVAHCIEAHVRLIAFGPQPPLAREFTLPMTFRPGGIPID